MRRVVTSKQISFFQENGYIEFEKVLSTEESKITRASIKRFFSKDLHPEKFITSPISFFIEKGRDLFLQDSYLKKITLRRSLAEIAATLSQNKALRFGFEQVFYTNGQVYPPFKDPFYPNELFSIQKLEVLLCIRLSFSKQDTKEEGILPKEQGNGVFLSPEFPLDLAPLFATSSQYFLLIGYAGKEARFAEKEKDPLSSHLKKLGYAAGDLLKEPSHPIVFQKKHNWF